MIAEAGLLQVEAYTLEDDRWRLLAEASGDDTIAVAPFNALQLDLRNLWG